MNCLLVCLQRKMSTSKLSAGGTKGGLALLVIGQLWPSDDDDDDVKCKQYK